MTQLNDKILKAIQEDLPQATAGELKKFIEEANEDKVALKQALDSVATQGKKLLEYKEKEEKFTQAEKLNNEAEVKLKEAKALSDKYTLDVKDEQIRQRDFVINKFEGFLNNLVKNPRAIEMINEHTNYSHSTHYDGNMSQQYKTNEWKNGTIEKIETKD